jgi:hypothetical protein
MSQEGVMGRDLWIVLIALLTLGSQPGLAHVGQTVTQEQQKTVDTAVACFEGGGAWSFRLRGSAAPSAGGSIVVLKSARSKLLRYSLGVFQFDPPPKDPIQMAEVIATVPAILQDRTMCEAFAARFAKGIEAGRLQAYVLNRPSGQDKKALSLEGGAYLKPAGLIMFLFCPIEFK